MRPLSTRWTVAIGLLLPSYARFVFSQTVAPSTTATCSNDFQWMYNSKGQSPCLVAAYLQATCFTNGAWSVNALDPGTLYLPPTSTQVNPCQCNTVTYNMISACAACQTHGWVGFKTWVQSCPEGVVQVQTYPFKLNSDTAVPGWAYIDTSAGTFDVNQALKVSQNSTGDVTGSPSHTGRLSVGTIVAIVVVAILLIAIPLVYIVLRRKPSLNPFRSGAASTEAGHTPVRVQPLRMKSIWLGDEHKYSPIQKPNPRTSPVTSIFSPGGALGRLRGSRGGTPIIESGRPTSKFEIDKDTVIEGGAGDEEDPGETSPALGHRQQPSAGGHSNSSWHSILRSRPQVEQHEDIGSAVDFTFVSSNANNNAPANDQQPAEPTSRDPSPEGEGRGPYSWWSRNPPHRYPPIPSARRNTDLSTIYPSDSISNLQLRENLDDQPQQAAEQEQNPVILLRPPQGRNTPSERREAERVELRARQEEEARRELAALELMSPLGTESSIHTEKYSPPPHRSRLPQMPSSDPVMLYPGTVRANVAHTPPGSR